MSTRWRDDPDLAGRFHPNHPDDLQVVVHDGEPRRTKHALEACWVRATHVHGTMRCPIAPENARPPLDATCVEQRERTVYAGTLVNQPHGLTTVREGDTIRFVHVPGIPHPLMVTEAYLQERQQWAFTPCSGCGADQGLDPPTVMARTRFPDAPPGSAPIAFTAICSCGGTMVLATVESPPKAAKNPWWKFAAPGVGPSGPLRGRFSRGAANVFLDSPPDGGEFWA